MKKNIIKAYSKKITKEDIIKYSLKENIHLTSNELNTIYNSIKNDIDIILSNKIYDYVKSKKHLFNIDVYNKMIELINKYKDFIIK